MLGITRDKLGKIILFKISGMILIYLEINRNKPLLQRTDEKNRGSS